MANNQQYDVAITGGGLAGLTTAIQCADAGYNVLLVEKELYPFHKVCGEYISMESFGFLERIGLPLMQWNLPVINTLHVSDPQGRLYEFPLPLGGFGISRYMLDNELYKLATQKGVTILTQTKVNNITYTADQFVIETASGNFFARCATGCFGKRSNLDVKWRRSFISAKSKALTNHVAVKYHIRYPQSKQVIALHNFYNGYCGISNIENGICCLCYLTTAGNLKNNNNSIKQMEENVLMQNPQLRSIFSEAEFIFKEPVTISQVSFAAKKQVYDHILLAGDAAGMITPLCGNGMSMAMHAGKLAFICMHAFLQGQIDRNTMERHYTALWRQQFSNRLFTGRVVQRLFGNKTTTAIFLKLMHKNAWLAKKLISSTHGSTF